MSASIFSPTPLPNPVVAPPAAVEFDMSAADFERIRVLIRRRAGIALNPSKRTMVYSRLARRLRATTKPSFTAYLDWLEASGPAAAEWQEFVNALTTNLTSFFREAHHFDVLQEHLRKLRGRERVNIWCCAASTGEEPYTIAIAAMEAFASMDPPVRILATDIDTNVLETARAASYRDEGIARLDTDIVRKYFVRGSGANAGQVKVRPEVASLVTFRQLNLLDAQWPLRTGFDAIFCRNVMIYFDKPTQLSVLKRMIPLLSNDGLFFAGHSESFFHAADVITSIGRTIYRRSVRSAHESSAGELARSCAVRTPRVS